MSPLRVENDVCFGSVYNLRTEEQYPLVSVTLFIIACRIVLPLRSVPLNIGCEGCRAVWRPAGHVCRRAEELLSD